MAKNKKNKKNELIHFNEMLEENIKHISVLKDEKGVDLSDLVSESASKTTAVPFDAVVPVSAADAAKEKKNIVFSKGVFYTSAVFKLFENAMSMQSKQTIILTVDAEDVPYIFEPGVNETITSLYGKTDLSLIFKEMARPKKKLEKWLQRSLDESVPFDIFVLNIPDVVLFTNKIRKDKVSEGIFFNLCIQVVKSKKKVEKLKKKGKIEELDKFIIKCTMENIKNLGMGSVVTELTEAFAKDWYELAENWSIYLKADEDFVKMVDRLTFTVVNSTGFAISAKQIAAE